MKRSSDPQSVLDKYRASLSPGVATRERAWDGLAARAAAGEAPSLATAPPPPVLPVAAAGLARGPALLAGALGASALLIAAAWSWRALHAPSPQTARELPRAAAAGPERAAPSQAEPQRITLSVAVQPAQVARGAGSSPAPAAHEAESSARPAARTALSSRTSATISRNGTPAPSASAVAHSASSQSQMAHASGAGASFAPFGATQRVPMVRAPERSADTAAKPAPQLEEELRLLRSAYEALRSGHPKRALNWLGEHAARFPRGSLAEARDVARIMALCQAGQRNAARTEAAHFLQLSPRSPHAGRVRSLCTDTGEPP